MGDYIRRRERKKVEGPTKLVRIDERTQIEVSVDISDEEARKKFLETQQEYLEASKNRIGNRPSPNKGKKYNKESDEDDIPDIEGVGA